MRIGKSFIFLLASGLFLSLASCGKHNKSRGSHKEVNPVCSEINCLSSINWKVQLQGRTFPDKARVDINGTTVLNECVSKQRYTIDRYSEPQSLYLESYFVPKRGELKIQVMDLGNCDSESTFISDDNVDFEVVKSVEVNEILVNL